MSDDKAPGRARTLLNASPGALIEVDASGVIVFVNPAAARLLHRPVESLVGQTTHRWNGIGADGEVLPPDQRPSVRALRGESVSDFEMIVLGPDGERIPVGVAAEPLRDDDDVIVGAVIALTDFSEVKRVRDQLRHSRERLAYALSAAKMIAWDWDPRSGLVDHTDDVNANVGERVEKRDQFQQLIHPDDRERVRQTFEAALRSGSDYLCEYRLLLPQNIIRWVESRGRASVGPEGEPRMSGVISDITDRKAAEHALAEGEERLRIAVEGAGAGFYDVDLGTGDGVWSRASFAMLGLLPPTDGRSNFDLWRARLHPEDAERVLAAHEHAAATHGSLIIDYRIIRGDTGEERWLSTYGRIFDRPDGSLRSVGIVLDITDRRRADEREKLLMREVDHRAKNVLAVVQSLLQLTPRRDVESFVHGVTGRIAAIARVHTLLAQSRWRVASVFSLVRDELAPFRAENQITISGEDVAVPPDVAQALAMVVHELATNAAKYGALSRKDGLVEINVERAPNGLALLWRERAHHILGAPARQGFGLRLIKQLVERQLDGAVAFEWDKGALTARLSFQVELAKVEALRVEAPPPAPQLVAELAGRTVMVLEDDGLISMALQEELERHGAKPSALSTIESALGYLQQAKPDMAVLDVNVHGRAAAAVAEALVERGVPFIYATGYSDELGELPRAPIVRKPCTPGEVCAALRRVSAPPQLHS